MGSLGDRIGRKRLLLIGTVTFACASVIAAVARSPQALIGARLLLGVAGATLMPSTLSILRNVFTDQQERTRAIAIWTAAAGGGAAVGPLVGGTLLQHFWWGSVFLINVPVMVVLVVAGTIVLPESRDSHPGPFDIVSALLVFTAVVSIVYAVKHFAHAGVDGVSSAVLSAGLVVGWWFVRRQRRLDIPMIAVDLFRHRAFSGAVFASFVAVFALTGLLFFLSQYFQLVRGYSPLQAGAAGLPATLSFIAAASVVGWLVSRLGPGRSIACGLLTTATGLVAIAAAEGRQDVVLLALALGLVGLGTGVAESVTVDTVVSAVPPNRAGAASAIAETAYELGVALGIAVLGSLTTALYRSEFDRPSGLSEDQYEAAKDSLAAAVRVLPDGTAIEAARHAFTNGMQTTAVVAAAITAAGALLAWRTIPSTAQATPRTPVISTQPGD
jgi:DHA2 family multidrug resistance protein-like MFS transporter